MKSQYLSDFFTHLGWAFWGQECECGHNPFNWLARLTAPHMTDLENWNDRGEPTTRRGRLLYWVGERIYELGERD